jgi:hypothetical protein
MKHNAKNTLDEVCGVPNGTFHKFLKKKKDYTKQLETERSQKLKQSRCARP